MKGTDNNSTTVLDVLDGFTSFSISLFADIFSLVEIFEKCTFQFLVSRQVKHIFSSLQFKLFLDVKGWLK